MTQTCGIGLHDDHDVYAEMCPCRTLLDLLANKWSALVMGLLDDGPYASACCAPGFPASARRC